jgi:hypothetical protein
MVEEAVRWRIDARRAVRLALHPADVADPHLLLSTERLLEMLARSPAPPVTYGRAVADARHRTSSHQLSGSPVTDRRSAHVMEHP